jgi:hypothetical protein
MTLNSSARIALTLLLVAGVAWLGSSSQFYTEALISAYFALTLAGVMVIHLRIHPSWLDALLILAGTFLFAAIDFRLLHFKPAIMCWFSFAGLTSLLVLAVRTVWSRGEARKLLLLASIPATLFVVSEYFADTLLVWTSAAQPKVFDLYLYSFDASLHIQPAFLVGKAFAMWPWLRVTSILFYIGLSMVLALIYVGRVLRVREKAIPCFVAFFTAGPIGTLFYNLLPALGPAHLFHRDFPLNPLSIEQASHMLLQPLAMVGYRNAIPSLHMAWVLLAWWYSRGLAWWERAIALLFLVFTVLSTLGTGEHYLIDLVVAFPFALLLEALYSFSLPWSDARRITAIVSGLSITLAWIAALRFIPHFFWSTPVLPWTLCAATVAFIIYLERQLQRTAERAPSETPCEQTAATNDFHVTKFSATER